MTLLDKGKNVNMKEKSDKYKCIGILENTHKLYKWKKRRLAIILNKTNIKKANGKDKCIKRNIDLRQERKYIIA